MGYIWAGTGDRERTPGLWKLEQGNLYPYLRSQMVGQLVDAGGGAGRLWHLAGIPLRIPLPVPSSYRVFID